MARGMVLLQAGGGWGVPVMLFLLWCMLSSASTPMHEKHTSQPTINKDFKTNLTPTQQRMRPWEGVGELRRVSTTNYDDGRDKDGQCK